MKKGYTLVELLVSITILGFLIAMIAISAIHFYNEQKEKEYTNISNIMKANAKVLAETDDDTISGINTVLTDVGDTCKITFANMVSKKLMDADTINPKTGEVMSSSIYVEVKLVSGLGYDYTFVDPSETTPVATPNCIN